MKSLLNFWINITPDYILDFDFIRKIREFSDGLTIFEFDINWDRFLMDHSPRFEFLLILFNIKIIELSIYYAHHRKDT